MAIPKNILVLTTWDYKSGLIQSSTLPYLKIIHQVAPSSKLFLVTQEKSAWYADSVADEITRELQPHNICLQPQLYSRFGIKKILSSTLQFISLLQFILTNRVSHIHCFCTPAGATGYLLSVLTGRKLVIDSFEPHAESMVENGTWQRGSLAFRLLWLLEKKQAQRASYLLNAASGMEHYTRVKYGVVIKKFRVRPCCVDLEAFQYQPLAAKSLRHSLGWSEKIVCVYAGKIGGIYLEQEIFDFFHAAYLFWGDDFRVLLLGTSLSAEALKNYCANSNLPPEIIHAENVRFEDMAGYLSVADFALTPVKPVPSKRYCSPIKDGEYWALGLPVVITKDISDDSALIQENRAGAVISDLNEAEYKMAVQIIGAILKEEPHKLRTRIRDIAITHRNYAIAQAGYYEIYGGAVS